MYASDENVFFMDVSAWKKSLFYFRNYLGKHINCTKSKTGLDEQKFIMRGHVFQLGERISQNTDFQAEYCACSLLLADGSLFRANCLASNLFFAVFLQYGHEPERYTDARLNSFRSGRTK